MLSRIIKITTVFQQIYAKLQTWSVWMHQHSTFRLGINLFLIAIFMIFITHRVSGDWRQLIISDLTINPKYIGAAIALYGVNFALFSWIWHSMILRVGGPRDWRLNISLYAYTYLAKFLPTPLWFVGGRITAYQRMGIRKRTVLSLTALEIVLHFITGALVLIALLFEITSPISWLASLLPLMLIVIIGHPQLLRRIAIVTHLGNGTIPSYQRDAGIWLSAYIISWGIAGLFAVCVIKALSLPITPFSFVNLWSAWITANLIAYLSMFTLGGVGFLRELSLVWFLEKSYSLTTAILIATSARLIMTLAGLTWAGLIFVITRVLYTQAKKPNETVLSTREE